MTQRSRKCVSSLGGKSTALEEVQTDRFDWTRGDLKSQRWDLAARLCASQVF